jgi:hypothetical protein
MDCCKTRVWWRTPTSRHDTGMLLPMKAVVGSLQASECNSVVQVLRRAYLRMMCQGGGSVWLIIEAKYAADPDCRCLCLQIVQESGDNAVR